MNIIFFGSHQYSLSPLEALFKAGHKIVAVVTQPDRPIGRHQTLTPTPVKKWAVKNKIPVFLRCEANTPSRCITLTPDLGIVCVYGEIIPSNLLKLPKNGFLNLHPSLLPKFRGASPVQAAIISGEKETGVTIFQMDEKLDHGPILCQEKVEIKAEDTAGLLYQRLFEKASGLLIKILPHLKKFENSKKKHQSTMAAAITDLCFEAKELELFIPPRIQNDSKASYTRQLKRIDGFIPWESVKAALQGKGLNKKIKVDFITDSKKQPFYILHSTFYIHNLISALSPWPGAWTEISIKSQILVPSESPHRLVQDEVEGSNIKKKRLKLLKSHLENNKLVLDLVQLEGEKPNSFKIVSKIIA